MIRPRAVVVACVPAPVFDGRLGDSFEIRLTADVVPIFQGLTPGKLYALHVDQDLVGGRAFPFPATARGLTDISPTPGYRTVQLFVALKAGALVGAKLAATFEAP